jgi:NDP-sugar pyrophosphorylase family protein/thiamine kinase-like enzyme
METSSTMSDRAIILAAGLSTRMYPLRELCPKSLLPIWDKSGLARMIDTLNSWGTKDIIINTHYRPGDVLNFIREYRCHGTRIQLSYEPTILGTGGVLKDLQWFRQSSPVMMINSDILCELQPEPLFHALNKRNTIASTWLYPDDGPKTVSHADGKIIAFRNPAPGADAATFTGVQIIKPQLDEFFPEKQFFSVIETYERAMNAGWNIGASIIEKAYWADFGTPETYLQVHADMDTEEKHRTPKRKGVTIDGFASISNDAMIDPGTYLKNVVVLNACHIKAKANLKDCVVATDLPAGNYSGCCIAARSLKNKAVDQACHWAKWDKNDTIACVTHRPGSMRRFTRLCKGKKSILLIEYSRQRKDNQRFSGHSTFLKSCAVPVPDILLDRPSENWLLTSWNGSTSLLDIVSNRHKGSRTYYKSALKHLHTFHHSLTSARRIGLKMEPSLLTSQLMAEHRFFIEHFVHSDKMCSAETCEAILHELKPIASRLCKTARGLIHRDMQSSNVLIDRNKVVFIDYQGMREGPILYDLASFLADPYVAMDIKEEYALLHYYTGLGKLPSIHSVDYESAVLQRLCQASGAFIRLTKLGAKEFAQYAPRALRRMKYALSILNDHVAMPELTRLVCSWLSK